MKKTQTSPAVSAEPIGIIISRGSREEPMPMFAEYVWGPVPDTANDTTSRAA